MSICLTSSSFSVLGLRSRSQWLFLEQHCHCAIAFILWRGWSGGAMVLGKLPVPGRATILIIVGLGSIALAVGTGGVCSEIFTLLYPFPPLSPSLWETARYRLKYCLIGPLNSKQPNHFITSHKYEV